MGFEAGDSVDTKAGVLVADWDGDPDCGGRGGNDDTMTMRTKLHMECGD